MDLSSSSSTDNQLVEPGRFPETQPLLPVTWPIGITFKEKLARANFLPRKLHIPSKSAVLILFWSLLVGAIYMTAKEGVNIAAKLSVGHQRRFEFFHSYDILLTRLVFVLVFLLYPFAGFLVDVCYGRYRVFMISLCLLACGMALLSVDSIFLFTGYTVTPFNKAGQVKLHFSSSLLPVDSTF